MKRINYGFSLIEIALVMTFIGIVSVYMLNVYNTAQSDNKRLLFKKAYQTTQTQINEMINDENLYSPIYRTEGFNILTAAYINNHSYSGEKKFCHIFASKLNTINPDDKCDNSNASLTNFQLPNPHIISSDGIAWLLPIDGFASGKEFLIQVDVNGNDKPNCKYNATNCKNPDRFNIYFSNLGKVYVKDCKEHYAISTNEASQYNNPDCSLIQN